MCQQRIGLITAQTMEFSTVERKFTHAITDFFALQSSALNMCKRYAWLGRIFGVNERGGGGVA
jgi:hypothetical protein